MCDYLNQTEATRQEILANREAAMRVADRDLIKVEWLSEDGTWYTRHCFGEAATHEFETKLDNDQIEHRRVAR